MERTDHRNQHPYRATKLWNEILFAFRFGMPLKRHRRHMKVHENCFTANDAVQWLQNFLQNNPNFGPHVTRSQTVQLLKKFYKSEVFQDVKKRKTTKVQFTDDNSLYRFSAISTTPPQKSAATVRNATLRTPLAALNSNHFLNGANRRFQSSLDSQKIQNLNSSPVPLKPAAGENFPPVYTSFAILLWKKLVLRRLMSMLGAITLDGVLDITKVNGQNIVHNVTRLDRNGVVAITDKSDEFPHWILLAMKCLASWPNARGNGSCLPNYPGFAIDVFQVVKDYFTNLGEPLIPSHFYKLVRLILQPLLQDMTLKECVPCNGPGPIWKYRDNYETSTPVTQESIILGARPTQQFHPDCRLSNDKDDNTPSGIAYGPEFFKNGTVSGSRGQDECLFSDSLKRNRKAQIRRSTSLPRLHTPAKQVLVENHPWHRSHEIHASMPSDLETVDHAEDLTSSQYYRHEANNGFLGRSDASGTTELRCCSYRTASISDREAIGYGEFCNYGVVESESLDENSSDEDDLKSDKVEDLNLHQENCEFINDLATSCRESSTLGQLRKTFDAKLTQGGFSENCKCQTYSVKDALYECRLSESDRSEVVQRLRYCTLLLNPPERHKLHLMLQYFQTMIRNDRLDLCSTRPVKLLLVETFSPCILCDKTDCDDRVSLMLTSFLINNVNEIFNPPADLKDDFRNIWKLHCEREMMFRYAVHSSDQMTYCKQVSQKKYEEQKSSALRNALGQLLHDILRDPKLTEKQRQRRINQFKENHPDIYALEFPHDEQQPRSEGKPNLLTRIKNFRL